MTRLIHLIPEPALVNVTFLGPVSFSDRIEMIETVGPLIEKHGLQGLLLDYTQAWVGESPAGAFEQLEALLRASTWLEGLRVALVSPADFHAVPIEPLGDEVGYEIRRFYTRPAAIAWLAKRAS